jgi:anti-sigma regulatory factor (Ser/Thr protein kinase)
METLTRPPGTGTASVELGGAPRAVRAARLYVEDALTGWGLPDDLVFTAKQLTSELATNAITHGSTGDGTFTLEVRSFGCCLGVEVIDGGGGAPVVCSPAADIENGRGLLLVIKLADSWGYYFDAGRKHVWFHLCITNPTPPPAGAAVMPAA